MQDEEKSHILSRPININQFEGLREVAFKTMHFIKNHIDKHELSKEYYAHWLVSKNTEDIWINQHLAGFLNYKPMKEYINSIRYNIKNDYDKKLVLDLGCGTCRYWPVLKYFKFDSFVGIDLFTKKDSENIFLKEEINLANLLCDQFDIKNRSIIEADVNGDLDNIFSTQIDWYSEKKPLKFDVVMSTSSNYCKNNKGIPKNIFNPIADKYILPTGIKILFAGAYNTSESE